jgi:hypothetical protein
MHLFHKWSKWTDVKQVEVISGDAVMAFLGKDTNYKPAVTRIDLRQVRRCDTCGAAQYRKTSA